jgi:16S rRNA processing protein RimM
VICAGFVTGLHGIKGKLKVRRYLQDFSVVKSAPLFIKEFKFFVENYFCKGSDKAVLSLQGISTVQCAQSLLNEKIFIQESFLPKLEQDNYYHKDLVNMCIYQNDKLCGNVLAVHNFGASDILEVKLEISGKNIMIPFTKEFILSVDIQKKRINAILSGL